MAQKKSFTAIAAELGRSVPTVSREVGRNSGLNGYRAARADRLATARTARPRAGKLAEAPALRAYVEDKLQLHWFPEQISRRLVLDHSGDPSMRVSHETIYTSLFVQTKAVLRTEPTGILRIRRVHRRPQRRVSRPGAGRGRIPQMTPVSERPTAVDNRFEPGHWEGDLVVGRYGRSHLITLVERHSRCLVVIPIPDATSGTVIAELIAMFAKLPETCVRR